MTRRKFRPLQRRTGEGLHPPATAQEPLPVTGIPDEVQHPRDGGARPKETQDSAVSDPLLSDSGAA